jgi:hypothetical protein
MNERRSHVQLVFARQLASHTPVEPDVRNRSALITIVGKHLPARCGV